MQHREFKEKLVLFGGGVYYVHETSSDIVILT